MDVFIVLKIAAGSSSLLGKLSLNEKSDQNCKKIVKIIKNLNWF